MPSMHSPAAPEGRRGCRERRPPGLEQLIPLHSWNPCGFYPHSTMMDQKPPLDLTEGAYLHRTDDAVVMFRCCICIEIS